MPAVSDSGGGTFTGTGTGDHRSVRMSKRLSTLISERNVVLYTDCGVNPVTQNVAGWLAHGTGSGGYEYAGTGSPGSDHARRRVFEYGECYSLEKLYTGTGTATPHTCCDTTYATYHETFPETLYACVGFHAIGSLDIHPGLVPNSANAIYDLHGMDPSQYPISQGGGTWQYIGPLSQECKNALLITGLDLTAGWTDTIRVNFIPCQPGPGQIPLFGTFSMSAGHGPPPWAFGGPPPYGWLNPWMTWTTTHGAATPLNQRGNCRPYFWQIGPGPVDILYYGFEITFNPINVVVSANMLCAGTGTQAYTGTGTGSHFGGPSAVVAANRAMEKRLTSYIRNRLVTLRACCQPHTGTGTGTATSYIHNKCCPNDGLPPILHVTLSSSCTNLDGASFPISYDYDPFAPSWKGTFTTTGGFHWTFFVVCGGTTSAPVWTFHISCDEDPNCESSNTVTGLGANCKPVHISTGSSPLVIPSACSPCGGGTTHTVGVDITA